MRRSSHIALLTLSILLAISLMTIVTTAQDDNTATPESAEPTAVEPTVAPVVVQPEDIPLNRNLEGFNIYFSEPAGEPSRFDRSDIGMSRYAGLLTRSGANLFTLEWRNGFPTDADLVIIPLVSSDLTAEQVAYLWSYLSGGGKVLMIVDITDTRSLPRFFPSETRGFFALTWSDLGLRAKEAALTEAGEIREVRFNEVQNINGENVEVERVENAPQLNFEFTTTDFEARHPITNTLDGTLYYNGARPIEIGTALQNFDVLPLLFDGIEDSYGEVDFGYYAQTGFSQYNIGRDTGRGRTPIAAAYDNPETSARMVLLGDFDILKNGTGFQSSPSYSPNFVFPTNIQFMMNTTAWLLGADNADYTFPAPEPTATATITPTPTPTATPEDGA